MSARNPPAHSPVKIEPLGRIHDRAAFSCGSDELDTYLRESASREARKQISTSFVLVEDGDNSVIGYYSLSATRILLDDLPEKTAKKLLRYPDVPTTRLGRLAVDMHHKGMGYGEVLLVGALRRSFQAATEVASYAVVVDSKDDQARLFYGHYGFIAFPDHALRMFLPMQTIARLFV